jgi:hypothetical protein
MSEFRAVSVTAGENPREILRHLHEMARAINLLGEGKSGNVITVTLTANSATTNVVAQSGVRIGPNTAFYFFPLTANAQTELQAGGPPYALTTDFVIGQVTLRHRNNAQTDRTFRVLVVG